MRCERCEAGRTEPIEIPEQIEAARHTFRGALAGRRCRRCGAVSVDGAALERFELAAAVALAEAGCASSAAFRFLRESSGLRARELAPLLDVAAETVSRWERGALPIERRALALLGCLVVEKAEGRTATLDRLRALARPRRLAKVVRLANPV